MLPIIPDESADEGIWADFLEKYDQLSENDQGHLRDSMSEGQLTKVKWVRLPKVPHKEADDVVWIDFIQAYEKLAGYEDRCRFGPWMFTIASWSSRNPKVAMRPRWVRP